MRIAVAAGTVVALAVALVGCSAPSGPGSTYITASGSEPQNPLIPAFTVEAGGARVVDSIFAGLVLYQADGSIQNDVADTITPNVTNNVFTVKLRDGLTFSDGSHVDANAFVKAWDWNADSANETPVQGFFSDITGFMADDPETPDLERGSLIEAGGLVVVDPLTFEIHLTAPLAEFPQRLGLRAFDPLPPSFFGDVDDFGEHPIGNGPYMLAGEDAWQHGTGIELALNPSYDGPRTPVNGGVSLKFYDSPETAYVDVLAGFLDVIDTIPASALPSFDGELGFRSIDQPGAQLESLAIPVRLPHLSGKEGTLRRSAISKAIDRDGITAGVYAGLRLPAKDFTAPVVDGYSDGLAGSEVLSFQDDEAKLTWGEAEEMSPWEGAFEIAYVADSGQETAATAAAASISQVLGIEARAVPYPSADDLDAVIADGTIASAFITDHTAEYPGPLPFLQPFFVSKAPQNGTGYASKLFDAELRAALRATTDTDMSGALQAAQSILLTDLPAIPLWYTTVQAGWGERVDHVAVAWDSVPQYWQIVKTR